MDVSLLQGVHPILFFSKYVEYVVKMYQIKRKRGASQVRLGGGEWGIFGPFDTFQCILERFECGETI